MAERQKEGLGITGRMKEAGIALGIIWFGSFFLALPPLLDKVMGVYLISRGADRFKGAVKI